MVYDSHFPHWKFISCIIVVVVSLNLRELLPNASRIQETERLGER